MFLAQSVATNASWFWPAIIVMSGFAVLGISVLFLLLLFRHLRADRQLLNAKRMRSLDAGFPLEAPEAAKIQAKFLHNAFWISFWLVFSVPAAAFSAASAATREWQGSTGTSIVIWIAAGAASIAAVCCATALMLFTRFRKVEEADGPWTKKGIR
jgi:hypothetical protein